MNEVLIIDIAVSLAFDEKIISKRKLLNLQTAVLSLTLLIGNF